MAKPIRTMSTSRSSTVAAQVFDLTGFELDDIEGGSSSHVLTGTLAVGEIRVFFRSETDVALNDSGGDTVRLLAPDGSVLDEYAYPSAAYDQAWARDEGGAWHEDWLPSPGEPNQPPPTPTPTPTPGPLAEVLISEVVYDGDIYGQGDEFVELWNPSSESVSLAAWRIGDEESEGGNEGMYLFPDGITLGPNATLVIARDADAFFERHAQWPDFAFRSSSDEQQVPLLPRDEAWASGHWALTDDGDEVLLIDRWGRVVDQLAFRNGDFAGLGLTGHDISAPSPRAIHHVGTLRTTNVNDWVAYELPTPGQPYRIPVTPPAPLGPEIAGLRVAWGSLHSHSTYSDGSGPPDLAFAVARANGLNFMGLTDHSHWYTEAERTRALALAQAASEPGAFLALLGFEWTHREQGHTNVFLTSDDASRERPEGETLAAFYAWLAARPQGIAIFNHPFYGDFDDFAPAPSVHDQFVGLEVGNGPAVRYERYEDAYWSALFKGWRIGALGNLDTETTTWGADGPLRTGVLLTSLTESDLFDALRARRTFATEDSNLALALRAGDQWMGSEVSPGTLTLSLVVSDPDAESAQVELLRDGIVVESRSMSTSALPQQWDVSVAARAGDIYVARVIQADGNYAWSSPIWVAGEATPLDPQLSEVLSAPSAVDWDSDGEANYRDEWIELYNPHDRALSLAGWRLEKATFGYTFPTGSQIQAGQHLVLYQRDTDLSLSNFGETIRLRAADGREVDVVEVPFQGYDRSKARCNGAWREGVEPTPGAPCTLAGGSDDPADGDGSPIQSGETVTSTIATVRTLPEDSRVRIEGIVTAAPGTFAADTMYVQDASGGIKVYGRAGLDPFELGDRVRLTGYSSLFYGEWEISVPTSETILLLARGEEVAPLPLAPGTIRDHPGELVQLSGHVEGWSGENWYLDDGVESVFIYHDQDAGVQRPFLTRGEARTVIGIVGWSERGPRLMPRTAADLDASATGGAADEIGPPSFLPTTGGDRLRQRSDFYHPTRCRVCALLSSGLSPERKG